MRIRWLESLVEEASPGINMANVPTGTSLTFSGGGDVSPILSTVKLEAGRERPADGTAGVLTTARYGDVSPALRTPYSPADMPVRSAMSNTSLGHATVARVDNQPGDDPTADPGAARGRSSELPGHKLAMPEGLVPSGQLFLDPTLESNEPMQTEATYGAFSRLKQVTENLPQTSVPSLATRVTAAQIRATSEPMRHVIGPPRPAYYPDYALALRFVEAYFWHSHTQSPFIHHSSFMERFRVYYPRPGESPPQMLFVCNMVLAIGETTLQRQAKITGKPAPYDGRCRFFEVAMDNLEASLEHTNLATVQCLLLLVVYGLQNPEAVSIYRTSGLAMRVCVELSLHREQDSRAQLTLLDRELRKRIFWSSYSLDRFVSIILGRPCAIVDENVSCELPADVDDSCILADRIQPLPPGAVTEMTYSICTIKLRRLSGRILGTLYCTQHRSNENLSPMVDRFVTELEAWRLTVPSCNVAPPDDAIVPSIYRSPLYLELGYFHTRLLLYRLLAPQGHPSDIRHCAEAALRSVQAYAQLLDEMMLTIDFATLAQAFSAGVTLLWCVFLSTPTLAGKNTPPKPALSMAEVQEGIACTAKVLLALSSADWETARSCRDLFKDLCDGVVVVSSSSSNGVGTSSDPHKRSEGGDEATSEVAVDSSNAQHSAAHDLLGLGGESNAQVEAVQADVSDLFARAQGQLPPFLRAAYGGFEQGAQGAESGATADGLPARNYDRFAHPRHQAGTYGGAISPAFARPSPQSAAAAHQRQLTARMGGMGNEAAVHGDIQGVRSAGPGSGTVTPQGQSQPRSRPAQLARRASVPVGVGSGMPPDEGMHTMQHALPPHNGHAGQHVEQQPYGQHQQAQAQREHDQNQANRRRPAQGQGQQGPGSMDAFETIGWQIGGFGAVN